MHLSQELRGGGASIGSTSQPIRTWSPTLAAAHVCLQSTLPAACQRIHLEHKGKITWKHHVATNILKFGKIIDHF